MASRQDKMRAEIKSLIEEYSELPILKKESNYLDIMGFSHYEDVISNILNFYLNPLKEHDLQDLLLRSLLEIYEDNFKIGGFKSVESVREKRTNTGKRIDLLIETNAYIIVIENKIYHTLENDLIDYSNYANSINTRNKKVVKIVLTLNKLNKKKDLSKLAQSSFKNITYKEYLKQIRRNYSTYALDGNTKYLILLNDLIKSLENRIGQNMETVKKWEFFEDKIELVEELISDYNRFVNDFLYNQKMNYIKENINLDEEITIKNRYKLQDTLVIDYRFGKNEIAIDASISTKGYRIEMFERGKSNEFIESDKFIELTQIDNLKELMKNGRYLHKELELKMERDDVISEIENFAKIITNANKAYNIHAS